MLSFWKSFEKQAVSANWLQKLYLSGMARRAGENTKGSFTKKLIEQGGQGPNVAWRKTKYGPIFNRTSSADKLKEISAINKRTKGDPGEAAKEWKKEVSELISD